MACVCVAACAAVQGQQPTNAPSATMPATGLLSTRTLLRYDRYDETIAGTGAIERIRLEQELMYGVAPDWVAFAVVPGEHREANPPGAPGGDDTGLGDATLGVRHRLIRRDPGPLDTFRASASLAVRLPTGDDAFSADAPAFIVGAESTAILGRHGFNAAAKYELITGSAPEPLDAGSTLADHARLALAYLYRLDPAAYDASTEASVYTQLELIGHVLTNGDHGLELAPGVLIEGRRWAAEASVIVPLTEETGGRPEKQIGVAFGLRLLF